jgi:hypothetical protein
VDDPKERIGKRRDDLLNEFGRFAEAHAAATIALKPPCLKT